MAQAEYRYCPACRTPLETRTLYGVPRRHCPKCGFIHFRDPKVSVVGLLTEATRVLLICRGVEPMKGRWALPGGYMDADEQPAGALARELREEVGLAVQVGPLLGIFPLTNEDETVGIVLAYAVHLQGGTVTPVAGDDVSEARWFEANALPDNLAFDSTRALLKEWVQRLAQRTAPGAEYHTKELNA